MEFIVLPLYQIHPEHHSQCKPDQQVHWPQIYQTLFHTSGAGVGNGYLI